jgi:hypothetical protein
LTCLGRPIHTFGFAAAEKVRRYEEEVEARSGGLALAACRLENPSLAPVTEEPRHA